MAEKPSRDITSHASHQRLLFLVRSPVFESVRPENKGDSFQKFQD